MLREGFQKTVGAAIANNAIPTDYDVITVAHKNNDIAAVLHRIDLSPTQMFQMFQTLRLMMQ